MDRARDPTQTPGDAGPDWVTITAIILAASAFAAEQGVTYPLISLLLERRGVAEWLIGLNVAAFTAGLAAAPLCIGRLTRLASPKGLLVGGLIGSAACLVVFSLFDDLWVWFVARFLLGFFASLTYVTSEAGLQSACSERTRGRVSGFYASGISLGFAAGPLAIPIFGTETKIAFIAVAIFVMAIGAFAAAALASSLGGAVSVPRNGILRWTRLAPLIFCMALAFGYADTVAISLMPVSLVQLGHSETFAALTVTMIALPTALAQPLIGMVLDRLPRLRVAIGCCIATALAFAAIALTAHPATILALYSAIGIATLALYTCAMTLLGERFSGGLLIAGSAATSLAYALGGVASVGTSVLMALAGPLAAPLSVSAAMFGFMLLFALAPARPGGGR